MRETYRIIEKSPWSDVRQGGMIPSNLVPCQYQYFPVNTGASLAACCVEMRGPGVRCLSAGIRARTGTGGKRQEASRSRGR